MDTDTVRSELEQVVREADASAAALEAEGSGESSELSSPDQHPADSASEISDDDREVALIEAAQVRKTEALQALARLDAGTYGTCIDCGEPIDAARLDFRPEAARCLADQTAFEARES